MLKTSEQPDSCSGIFGPDPHHEPGVPTPALGQRSPAPDLWPQDAWWATTLDGVMHIYLHVPNRRILSLKIDEYSPPEMVIA